MSVLSPDAGIEPGSLLVASPKLRDPSFLRTVIYILDHRQSGSVGVILNRPSEVTLLDVLPQWFELSCTPPNLFVGGPVHPNAALGLAECRAGTTPSGWTEVSSPIGLADLEADPQIFNGLLTQVRVFAGYAGWESGQLAEEIAEGSWLVLAGRASDVFAKPDIDLWRLALRRQGGRISFMATYPDDPRMN